MCVRIFFSVPLALSRASAALCAYARSSQEQRCVLYIFRAHFENLPLSCRLTLSRVFVFVCSSLVLFFFLFCVSLAVCSDFLVLFLREIISRIASSLNSSSLISVQSVLLTKKSLFFFFTYNIFTARAYFDLRFFFTRENNFPKPSHLRSLSFSFSSPNHETSE